MSPSANLKRKADVLDDDAEEVVSDMSTDAVAELIAAASAPVTTMKPEPELVVEATVYGTESLTNETLLWPRGTTVCGTVAQRPRKRLRRALNLAGTVATGFAIGAIAMVGGLTALPDNFFQ
jgi:hypothetical protein